MEMKLYDVDWLKVIPVALSIPGFIFAAYVFFSSHLRRVKANAVIRQVNYKSRIVEIDISAINGGVKVEYICVYIRRYDRLSNLIYEERGAFFVGKDQSIVRKISLDYINSCYGILVDFSINGKKSEIYIDNRW